MERAQDYKHSDKVGDRVGHEVSYYAHTAVRSERSRDQNLENWQLLSTHLHNVCSGNAYRLSNSPSRAKLPAGRWGTGMDFLREPGCCPPLSVQKKEGLRKPRMEVIVSTFRPKRLGSSQPILAARLVLIRSLYRPKPATSSIL